MPIDTEIPTHLNMRIAPQLRYLTELAARARGKSLTEYIEAALLESFKRVNVDPLPGWNEEPEVRELSPAERLEKLKKRKEIVSNPLSELADQLWSEFPLTRLQLLATYAEHLMGEEDRIVWRYIVSRKELKSKDGKLNQKKIHAEWGSIKNAALAESKTKAKVK